MIKCRRIMSGNVKGCNVTKAIGWKVRSYDSLVSEFGQLSRVGSSDRSKENTLVIDLGLIDMDCVRDRYSSD